MACFHPIGRVLLFVLAVVVTEHGPPGAISAELLPRHLLLLEAPVNRDDVFVGGTYRFLPSRRIGLGPFVSFDARSERLAVLQQIRSHFFIQRKEERYLGAFGLDESLPLGAHAGVFAAVGAGYTFGDYEGTRAQPDEGWTPILRAGVAARLGAHETVGHLRVGYEYADLRSVASNRTYIALGVEFR